jgi:hypothetical protein
MADDLAGMLARMEKALEGNRESVAALDAAVVQGNAIVRRKTLWIVATCTSVALDVALTATLAVLGFGLNSTQHDAAVAQADIRANTCNLNALLAQSAASSGNTVDLYRGLRPLLAESSDPDSRAAVAFIDQATANLESNARRRTDFLALTQDTAERLDCPAGFVAPGGR